MILIIRPWLTLLFMFFVCPQTKYYNIMYFLFLDKGWAFVFSEAVKRVSKTNGILYGAFLLLYAWKKTK